MQGKTLKQVVTKLWNVKVKNTVDLGNSKKKNACFSMAHEGELW